MENPTQMDDLGVPPFKETPIYQRRGPDRSPGDAESAHRITFTGPMATTWTRLDDGPAVNGGGHHRVLNRGLFK